MELKVGMYVITKNRMKIAKIIDFCDCEMCKNRGFFEPITDNRIFITVYDKDNNFADYEFYENIIELIEEGDYVNGKLVYYDEELKCLGQSFVDGDGNFYFESITKDWKNKIKTVLTKEQFENNVYRIGE